MKFKKHIRTILALTISTSALTAAEDEIIVHVEPSTQAEFDTVKNAKYSTKNSIDLFNIDTLKNDDNTPIEITLAIKNEKEGLLSHGITDIFREKDRHPDIPVDKDPQLIISFPIENDKTLIQKFTLKSRC